MLDKQIEKLRRRTFTVEFKVEAVKLKREQRLSYAEVGRRLDVLPKLVQQGEKQYDAGELSPEKAKRQITPERQEIAEYDYLAAAVADEPGPLQHVRSRGNGRPMNT